ncbi:hypothetical protein ACFO3O_04440 [Dokdonia ponticola]|uniref:Uncharacterized protein n=1 Tax=Dokdonia ponticola TaxID=2041041 RepID=A0ABV9HU82_9FLAO
MTTQTQNIQNGYHSEAKEWKSNLLFIETELHFIEQLIHSYVFEPNTPNLFERLEHFKTQLLNIKTQYKKIQERVISYDNELGGLLESHDTEPLDPSMEKKRQRISADYNQFITTYKALKSNIFEYCGGILKRNKK